MKHGAHFATHGKGVKFRLQGRESRLKKWTCVGWCMCLLTPRYMAYTHDAVTDEAREEVRYNIRYLCFPPVSHHLLRLCSCSCTNASQHTDVTLTSLTFFYKVWRKLCIYMYIHTNTSSVPDCRCQGYYKQLTCSPSTPPHCIQAAKTVIYSSQGQYPSLLASEGHACWHVLP